MSENINNQEELYLSSCPMMGPYQCEICKNVTDSLIEFFQHIQSEHPTDVDENVIQILKSKILKEAQKEGFIMDSELNEEPSDHKENESNQNVHTMAGDTIENKIKLLTCQRCSEAFKYKSEVKKHNKQMCKKLPCYAHIKG